MPEPLLSVRGLVAGYGELSVLRGVDLDIAPGAIVAVLGANGAGKTTLNKTLSGLLKPERGEVRFDGLRLDGKTPAGIVSAGLIHVPEGRRLYPDMSVRENLELG
ncbi:MAG TPA: ATP-binding cassette domain-containing protein, partial [Roseiarcus sp.]|nr:ATP-binding cassette domain-containing protein [Roseiarcus sp.]